MREDDLRGGNLGGGGPSDQAPDPRDPAEGYVTTLATVYIDDDGAGAGWERPGDSSAVRLKRHNRVKVMAHELLHTIGLAHSGSAIDLMFETNDPAKDQTWTCSPHDIAETKAIKTVLGEHAYLAGPFTFADIAFYMACFFAGFLGQPWREDCANLQRWSQRVSSRPSVQQVAGTMARYLGERGIPKPKIAPDC